MTTEIALAHKIVFYAILLSMSGWRRVDVVALVEVSSLLLTRLLTPTGLSKPTEITVWAIPFFSSVLSKTRIVGLSGTQVRQIAGNVHLRLLFAIMPSAAVLPDFMINAGVAVLMSQAEITRARKIKTPSSKVLLPMPIGMLLGDFLILIADNPITKALEPGSNRFLIYSKVGPPLKLFISGIAMLALPLAWLSNRPF